MSSGVTRRATGREAIAAVPFCPECRSSVSNSLQLIYDFFSSYTKLVLNTVRGVSRCIFLLTNDTYSLVIGGVKKCASTFVLHIKGNVTCRGRGGGELDQ